MATKKKTRKTQAKKLRAFVSKKKSRKCGACGKSGHNRRTCKVGA
jgi:hypothetical protein